MSSFEQLFRKKFLELHSSLSRLHCLKHQPLQLYKRLIMQILICRGYTQRTTTLIAEKKKILRNAIFHPTILGSYGSGSKNRRVVFPFLGMFHDVLYT